MPKQFVIYARKSTESEDRQVLSIESQIDEMKQVANRLGIDIVKVFKESQSASKLGRPVFQEMLQGIMDGKFSGILCWKPDRLARNPIDGGQVIWAMKQNDLVIQTTGQRYSADKDNMVMLYIHFGMAQKYTDDLSKNVKRGNLKKLKNGGWPGCAPTGYINNKAEKTIEPDPERFDLIRKLFDMVLEGIPPQRARDKLNNEYGFRTIEKKRSGGNPLSQRTLYKILKNKFYCGIIERKHDGKMRRFKGAHKRMITKEEYKQVQNILGGQSASQRTYNFAYTGMIKCGECGASISAYQKTKKSGKRYVYYRCTKKAGKTDCEQPQVSKPQLEDDIKSILEQITIPEEFAGWAVKWLRYLHEQETSDERQARENLQQEYNNLQNRIDKLTDLLLKDLIGEDEFKTKKIELQEERDKVKEKLEDNEQNADNWTVRIEDVMDFAKTAKERFEMAGTDERRKIVSELGTAYTLKDRTLSIELEEVWEMFANHSSTLQKDQNIIELSKNPQDKAKTAASAEVVARWQG